MVALTCLLAEFGRVFETTGNQRVVNGLHVLSAHNVVVFHLVAQSRPGFFVGFLEQVGKLPVVVIPQPTWTTEVFRVDMKARRLHRNILPDFRPGRFRVRKPMLFPLLFLLFPCYPVDISE